MRTFENAGRFLGSLEERVMELLWRRSAPMAVREVSAQLRDARVVSGDSPQEAPASPRDEARGRARGVSREAAQQAAPLAYTTVMTTLDRLYKKGLLERHKDGAAFVYEPAMSRDEYRRRIVESTVSGLIDRASDADPVLAAFVDAAAEVDEDNLKRLEELIAERRRSGR